MQDTAVRTTGRQWDFLEPVMFPSQARTFHGVLKPPSSGNTLYHKGQVICQKDDGSNEWAKIGTAGYTGPRGIIKYTMIVNANGQFQYGDTFFTSAAQAFDGSSEFYYQGFFATQDLITANEVQAETVTATGGTRTITVVNPVTGVIATTAPIAHNANAATIQAALEALANVEPGDIVVSGTGPYVYTFSGGQFAGRNPETLVIGTSSLTGGSSSVAQTDSLVSVGRMVRGTRSAGIIELGSAPVPTS